MFLQELKDNFEAGVLKIISDPKTALTVMLVMRVLSRHDVDESYLVDKNIYLTVLPLLQFFPNAYKHCFYIVELVLSVGRN